MFKLAKVSAVLALGMILTAPGHGQEQAIGQEESDSALRQDERPGEVIVARQGSVEVLDLRGCVEFAWQHNDALQAERQRRRELDGIMNQALSTGMPTVDIIGEWSRGRDPSFALDESFSGGGDSGSSVIDSLFPGGFLPAPGAIPAQTFWRASANLHWTLNPVKVIGAVGAANVGIDRQELIIEGAEHTVAEQTVTAYYGIILAAEVVAAFEAEVANQRELLEISQLRYEVGMATVQDTLQAAVRVANLIPQLRRAHQEVANAGSRLNALMGRDPKLPLTIKNETPIETDPINRDRALELAMRRPEIGQLELFVDILRKNRQAQKADGFPYPYLTMDGAVGMVAREIGGLDDRGHDFWRGAVALTIPIFDGMLTRGLVQESTASIRRTEEELSGLRRQVEVEVLELLDSVDTARENLIAAQLNLVRGEDLLEQMTMMYRVGKTDYLSVLVAEANRTDARRNLLQAGYEVLTLTASLKRAIGRSPLEPLVSIEGLVKGEN